MTILLNKQQIIINMLKGKSLAKLWPLVLSTQYSLLFQIFQFLPKKYKVIKSKI